MLKRIWLVAGLAACTSSHAPQNSTQTGNPPFVDAGRVTLTVTHDEVHIIGDEDAVTPGGATIEVTNLTTGEVIEGTAAADGSFDVQVDGSPNDTFVVHVASGEEESSAVYVVRGGAAIAGDDGSLSCEDYRELAGSVLEASTAAAEKSCNSDSDCTPVLEVADCYAGCDVAHVSNTGASQIEAAVQALNDGLCASFGESGCPDQIFHCPALSASSSCVDGQCTGPVVDPGTNVEVHDCTTCLTQRLAWGISGGLVILPVYYSELAPCARYNLWRTVSTDQDELACAIELAACNYSANSGAVLSALADADVQRAFAESPVLYGIDSRPGDGQVFEIKLDDTQIIDVGASCDLTRDSCVPTPPGVQALVDLLQAIDQELLLTDACVDATP